MNIIISRVNELDFQKVELLAKQLELDWEDASCGQFLVAKEDESIVGFGRVRAYPNCSEIATVGVIKEKQNKGIGLLLMKALINISPNEVFVTCVIPNFFKQLGFIHTKQYPPILQKKVDFCKSYNFCDNQVFVMQLKK